MSRFAETSPLHLAVVKQHEDRKAVKAAGIKPMSSVTTALARSGEGSDARYRTGCEGTN